MTSIAKVTKDITTNHKKKFKTKIIVDNSKFMVQK